MRTFITFFLLTTFAIGQEGIPANVGTGVLPPGLDGETDLNAIKQTRISIARCRESSTQQIRARVGSNRLAACDAN